MKEPSEQLTDDHAALDKVLNQLKTALARGDRETAHAKLDLFWARLAVHIRAEHLHLFPTIVSGLENAAEAQTVVAQLRQDHDFFMSELARAIKTMRQLLTVSEQSLIKAGLDKIANTIRKVEQRLIQHNEIEERQIYQWASTLLSSEGQEKLATRIASELHNRPARFAANTWSDE